MARPEWLPNNVPGAFNVTTTCISCGLCADIAPDHFRADDTDDALRNVVFRQPLTEPELRTCREALQACPVEAIEEG
jgi:ferredoxin